MNHKQSFVKQQLKPIILDLHDRNVNWEQIKTFIDADIVDDVKKEYDIQQGIKREQERLENRLEFKLKPEHIKLLQRMYVGWQTACFGAPEIDPKRPYGNSDVEDDIRDILKKPKLTDSQCIDLHEETKFALQIMLQHGKVTLGDYSRKESYTNVWNSALQSRRSVTKDE